MNLLFVVLAAGSVANIAPPQPSPTLLDAAELPVARWFDGSASGRCAPSSLELRSLFVGRAPELIESLEAALAPTEANDPVPWLRGPGGSRARAKVANLLGDLGDPGAVEVLMRLLEDDAPGDQGIEYRTAGPAEAAASSLGQLGFGARATKRINELSWKNPGANTDGFNSPRPTRDRLRLAVRRAGHGRTAPPAGPIDGRIVLRIEGPFPRGRPVEVHALGERGRRRRRSLSLSGRRIVFEDLPPGRYRVVILDKRLADVDIGTTVPGVNLRLELKARPPHQLPPGER